MNIRFAEISDITWIVSCYDKWSYFEGVLPPEFTWKVKDQDIRKSMDIWIYKFVICEIGNVTAWVFYIDTSFQWLRTLRVGNLIVKKEFRNQWIASAFIQFAESYAKKNRVTKLWLWTQKELKNAISCYEKNGFTIEAEQKQQFCEKDALLLWKILES